MNPFDSEYHELMKKIMTDGKYKGDRTGTGTYSIFGHQMRFDMQHGFPLLTTKKVLFRMLATELIWFIRGDTNIRFLLQYNNNIWNEWAFKNWVESDEYKGPDMTNFGIRAQQDDAFKEVYKDEMETFKARILEDDAFAEKYGDLGNVYGRQWRAWEGPDGSFTDQLKDVVRSIRNNPDSRRHIVTAWNPAEIDTMALPPCHAFFQFYVNEGKLSLQLYQRSGDVFLGVPFNIASYALLLQLVARECGLEADEFIHTLGDAHIYSNHVDAVEKQLAREGFTPPEIKINGDRSMFELEYEDLEVVDYESHSYIKAPIAV
ncbi:thymidylate synthase [Salinicoccus hispanicus]|uniref:Thymidylate synthase n=1 Tax=Salinicoccus hispanicus TaxID=157225 RepID=A0A6N8U3R1_9STAP|nr:thymidylate synthase [Salinicoccus hispanicus]MXQ50309.1 thymidylate synthase [Salinicoccus hispanicus]